MIYYDLQISEENDLEQGRFKRFVLSLTSLDKEEKAVQTLGDGKVVVAHDVKEQKVYMLLL